MKIPFGEWLPDQAPLGSPGITDAKNVTPRAAHYGPFRDLATFSDALTARCQGIYGTKANDGSGVNFAGDATKLYKLNAATWDDVSRTVGGAYATSTDGQWKFTRYGNNVVAANGVDALQKWVLSSSTNWAALGGSPPVAKYLATVREFLVVGNIVSAENTIQWCSAGNSESWTTGTLEADTEELESGGAVQGIIGGEVGHVFQERSIKRLVRVSAPVTFQIDEIERERGLWTPSALIEYGSGGAFLSQDGFYFLGNDGIDPIGSERVDRWFLDDLDQTLLYRVWGAVDHVNKLFCWIFPSVSTSSGGPGRLLMYYWPGKRWAYADIQAELIYAAIASGYTLEGLDAISSDIDALTVSLDSTQWQGGSLSLAAMTTAHRLAYFTGSTLEAIFTTQEAQLLEGGRTLVTGVAPLVDSTAASVSMGVRERQGDAVSYDASYTTQETTGSCPVLSSGRFHRAKVKIAAGETWTKAQGVDVTEMSPDGVA